MLLELVGFLMNINVERVKIASLFAAITERLVVFPFTDMLCATLFDVLLGGASLKQVQSLPLDKFQV